MVRSDFPDATPLQHLQENKQLPEKENRANLRGYLLYMAGETGIEPAALGFGDRCSAN